MSYTLEQKKKALLAIELSTDNWCGENAIKSLEVACAMIRESIAREEAEERAKLPTMDEVIKHLGACVHDDAAAILKLVRDHLVPNYTKDRCSWPSWWVNFWDELSKIVRLEKP